MDSFLLAEVYFFSTCIAQNMAIKKMANRKKKFTCTFAFLFGRKIFRARSEIVSTLSLESTKPEGNDGAGLQ